MLSSGIILLLVSSIKFVNFASCHCWILTFEWFIGLQILWNSSCLDSLLLSVQNDPPSSVVNDPACVASIRSLYQKTVREWIVVSLSQAPCTSQGLLQVCYSSFSVSWKCCASLFRPHYMCKYAHMSMIIHLCTLSC